VLERAASIIEKSIWELTSYLLRYTSAGWDEIDRRPIRDLVRMANGVGKIISAENGPEK
jgi:hypothetical protein